MLGFALAFVTAQSVAWADCCCGSLCRHKNECTGCGPQDRCPGGESSTSSCCDEDASQPAKTCSHQEPSSEIDGAPADAPPTPPAAAEIFLPLDLPAMDLVRTPVETGPPRAGPLDALPRHLALHVLI